MNKKFTSILVIILAFLGVGFFVNSLDKINPMILVTIVLLAIDSILEGDAIGSVGNYIDLPKLWLSKIPILRLISLHNILEDIDYETLGRIKFSFYLAILDVILLITALFYPVGDTKALFYKLFIIVFFLTILAKSVCLYFICDVIYDTKIFPILIALSGVTIVLQPILMYALIPHRIKLVSARLDLVEDEGYDSDDEGYDE